MNLTMRRVFLASVAFVLVLSLITLVIPAFSFFPLNNQTVDNISDNNVNVSVTFYSRTQEGTAFPILFHLNYLNSTVES